MMESGLVIAPNGILDRILKHDFEISAKSDLDYIKDPDTRKALQEWLFTWKVELHAGVQLKKQ